jgi:hypothetical protein
MKTLFAIVTVAVMVTLAAPAQAGVKTVATGLTNPRHLHFGPDGALYVAEAGIGGDRRATTCPPVDNMFSQPGPYGAGFTGRIARILPDGRLRPDRRYDVRPPPVAPARDVRAGGAVVARHGPDRAPQPRRDADADRERPADPDRHGSPPGCVAWGQGTVRGRGKIIRVPL